MTDLDLPPPGPAATDTQAARAFFGEALDGVRLATRLRLVCVPVLMAFMVFFMAGNPALWFVVACLLAYALFGVAELFVLRHMVHGGVRGPSVIHVMIVLEMALIAFAMFGSQALFDQPWPPQAFVDSRPVVYFFFVISLYAFRFSPWLMIWAALCASLAWSAGMTWLLLLPDSVTSWPADATMATIIAITHEPHFVDIEAWVQDVLVIMVTGFVLAGVVWRTRRLVRRQIAAARERANLARHFPPTMVDEIAGHGTMLDEIRSQEVAVMFADVVGFTRQAETYGPETTVQLLRGLHRRLENAVFDNGGTLDKFLGDGVMATFGAPRATPRDAANALDAGRAALAAVEKWNTKRAARGASPVRLSIGLHFGEVVLGDVGSERHLEFAVIGDVVNVASRIEHLSRELDASLVASDDLVARARAEGGDLTGLEPAGTRDLRGRDAPLDLWRLPR